MYTINKCHKYELIIKNSKFIALAYNINNVNNINKVLEDIKLEYPNATHYCYAYNICEYKKANDDGEPSGTAGMPILNVITSNNLTNVLVVVIRYFGGIKLGANGLIRAYTKVSANCIKEADLLELTNGYNIDIFFKYNEVKEIDYLLKDIKINKKSFDDLINYNLDVSKDFLNIIINNHIDYRINNEILIEINNK